MCISLGPISFGCSNNTTVNDNLTNTTQDLSNVLSTFSNSTVGEVNATNSISISVGENGFFDCDPAILSQNITGTVSFVTSIDDQQNTSLVNSLQNSISSQLAASSTTTQDLLSSALNSDTEANVNTTLNNLVSSNVTTSVVNNVLDQVTESNSLTLNLLGQFGNGGACTFTQSIALDVAASNIISNVNTAAQQNTTIQAMTTALNSESTGDSKGVGDLVSDVLGGLSAITIGIFLAVVLAIGVFLYFVVKLVRGNGSHDSYVVESSSPAHQAGGYSAPNPYAKAGGYAAPNPYAKTG
jgi:hypothetical protein